MPGSQRNLAVAEQERDDGDAGGILRAVIQRIDGGRNLVAVQIVGGAGIERPGVGGSVESAGDEAGLIGFVQRASARLRTVDAAGAGLQDQDVMIGPVRSEGGSFGYGVGPRRHGPLIDSSGLDLP